MIDDRAALGARAYKAARLPDIRARARAIASLVRSYVAAYTRWEPVGDDERTEPDVCRYCGKPVERILMRSGRSALVNPRPVRAVVLDDGPLGYVASCYRIHADTCTAKPAERLRYEPDPEPEGK